VNAFLRPALSALALLSLPATVAADEQPAAQCPGIIAPGGELAPWAEQTPLNAAASTKQLAAAALPVGKAAEVTLLQTPDVRYPLRPEKPGGSVSYGGLIGLSIAQAGTYRVAIGSGAWIDLVRDGKAVVSTSHGHGPDCSGIHKMVDFPLEPGRYTLQLAANGAPRIGVLVARLP
jgi:hypothetical protein